MLERMAACLPCASWPCAGAASSRHWQLWPGDFDDDAQPILTAPTPALAECLIPPSVSNLYDDRGRSSPESSAPSWDVGAGRPPVHQVRSAWNHEIRQSYLHEMWGRCAPSLRAPVRSMPNAGTFTVGCWQSAPAADAQLQHGMVVGIETAIPHSGFSSACAACAKCWTLWGRLDAGNVLVQHVPFAA